ncbi:MAG TPA: phenylalanine--tRNA ligase subunit beta [Candidatus Saccharimonadales bacterium]
MIISTNWLKKFTDITMPIDELATLIGARLVEIEEVVDLAKKYEGVIVARVVECEKLEGSDHLNVTKLDDGGVVTGIERDENGLVQVVCGAPNVAAGMNVAWLPPKSTVPQTFSDDEPFVLDARKLRGVTSNGMIASARELDLFDDHEGILEVDQTVEPGTLFAEAFDLNDSLLDIENKSLTHRPDAFGIVGFAREVAAIQGRPFTTPDWLKNAANLPEKQDEEKPLSVSIDDPKLSDRYQALVLTNVDEGKQSPLALQTYLARVGVRPISAIVDVTNYLMLVTGQPLHAFDYDKVVAVAGSADIHVRAGREKETLELLDGRTIELTPDDIVIAAGETAIALAGAMGGASTEIDDTTKNIILESATFNLYNLRATQMRHGIFSEAITRFTKGQPAELTAPVLAEAARMMAEHAGAKRSNDIAESYPGKREQATINLSIAKINDVLGSHFSTADVVDTLQNVEFTVTASDDNLVLSVTPPYWRADIHIDEDIIEEIGRLNGFDSIAPKLPRRDFVAVRPSNFDELRDTIRKILARAGTNEVLTYNFVHGDVIKKAGQSTETAYRIVNSISPDLQYYRQTLTPNLLGLVHSNIKAGFDDFALYEMNKSHTKVHGMTDEGVPAELNMLALVMAHKKANQGAPYYEAKAMLDYLASSLGLEFVYEPIAEDPGFPVTAPFEYRRSAMVSDKISGEFIGIVGEYKKSVARNFKLPEQTAGFEIGPEALLKAIEKKPNQYSPLSRYPSTERDVCFQVENDVTYARIIDAANESLKKVDLETTITPVDIYQPEGARTKNITVRIKLTAMDRTLESGDANAVVQDVISAVSAKTGAEIV